MYVCIVINSRGMWDGFVFLEGGERKEALPLLSVF